MTMTRLIVALLCVSTVVSAQTTSSPEAERILNHVKTLSSEEMGGRKPGEDGIKKAAEYIEAAYEEAGLKAAGDDGTYQDWFEMLTDVRLVDPNYVKFEIRRARPGIPIEKTRPMKYQWKMGKDYQPFGFTDVGKASGKVIFAGYGIAPHGVDYDDYAGIDVTDAVVVVIRGLPKWAEKNKDLRPFGALRTKATLARDKGAKAIVFVNEAGDSSDVLDRFGVSRMGKNSGIIALQVRRTPCAKIFPKGVPTLYVAEESINKTKKPNSFELPNTKIDVEANVEFVKSWTFNIAGLVRGSDSDLRDEYVVVGAHYDHLGMGGPGSRHTKKEPALHSGADDNGSGTAGLIELAQRMSEEPPRRSVLFIAFSGEESGLLGSKHWVASPTMPLENAVAMLNMDMIGRLKDNKVTIGGVGTSPSWDSILSVASDGTELKISKTKDGFGPSDHASFTPKKIPTLFYFTGLHTDYHRPSDTYEKLNYDGEVAILQVVENTLRMVADADERLSFTPGAEKPKAKATSGGFRVTLGVIPDYSDDPQGLRIDGVRDGTPADKAGMEGGDIITRIGKTKIKNIYDLTAVLSSAGPGEKVEIDVIRDGEKLTLSTTLTAKK